MCSLDEQSFQRFVNDDARVNRFFSSFADHFSAPVAACNRSFMVSSRFISVTTTPSIEGAGTRMTLPLFARGTVKPLVRHNNGSEDCPWWHGWGSLDCFDRQTIVRLTSSDPLIVFSLPAYGDCGASFCCTCVHNDSSTAAACWPS